MPTPAALLKSLARPHRPLLGLGAAATLANAALMIAQYRLLAAFAGALLFGRAAPDWQGLWPLLPLVAARALAVWLAETAAVETAARVKRRLRADLFDRLLELGPVRLAGEQRGALAALLVDGVEAVAPYYARFLPALLTVALLPLAVLAAVLPQDWISALVLAGTAPLIPLFMILIGKGAERLNQRQWAKLAWMSAHFLEAAQGLTTLKLFNAARREIGVIARISEDYRQATMAVLRVAFLSALVLEFFATLGVALVAVLIGFRLLSGGMSFTRGFFILLLAPEFYLPLRALGSHYHARMEAIAAAESLADLLSRPLPAVAAEAGRPPLRAAPRIRFEDVRLTYADGRAALDGVSFTLPAGGLTALVGPSGAGKSSVAALLMGFIGADGGHILADGHPLEAWRPEDWLAGLAWLPQRPHLFRGSIADNLRLARPEAGPEDLTAALERVGAEAMIAALPHGLEQPVGEGGQGLSGGQRRLIALARAALKDAPLLLLDEPTASLDRASEAAVAAALDRLRAGRTTLMIAHRLETVRAADQILVLERGRLIETGSHAALMAADGPYRALWRRHEMEEAAP
ncbi:ATP-binding/permease protein CydD [mine drainage metagenome]|uniref:ATP-binding/permease protein CydD n=1 Tax=mine drainage metagenome TaxID=410659 RepID=A0A1J5SD77_9ZZZZ